MEESQSPDSDKDPCHLYGDLYRYFSNQSSGSTTSHASADTAASSVGKSPLPSMLVTGFGLRNLDSLQRALLDDEQRRQMLLAQHDKDEEFECVSIPSVSSKIFTLKSQSVSSDAGSDVVSVKSPSLPLDYLMGLMEGDEQVEEAPREPREKLPSIKGEIEEEEGPRMTLAMRKARNYLKEHRIFDFFRFLIAHMASELPDNPIEFLIELLDKCLLYRSGFRNPPLLFEKPHIEQLFYMMDPMRTGFIEMQQYETGLKTLGICSYDKHPPLTTDGMVTKDFFIEEAYECLTDLFVDMVRRRGGRVTPPSLSTPPPTAVPPSLAGEGQ